MRQPETNCPHCQTVFTRRETGERVGYTLLGKGYELSLIRCESCHSELPVPESDDVSVSIADRRTFVLG